ncbi:MAG: polysaccharide pyruvyl transferase family protein [Hyphomonadaceae bacterium]
MIVTICGAYRNAGDHLIGARARALLRAHVDTEVVTVDRKDIGDEHYKLFNRARAVVLCGGPAYQREIFPKIYPLDLARVKPPVVPLGLGWKAPANKSPNTFQFEDAALRFITEVHARIPVSSVRDPLTLEVLNHAGVSNVSMTGCPAWYDLAHLERPYVFKEKVERLVLSMPAIMQPGVFELMQSLTLRFPNAQRTAAFHHGLVPTKTSKGRQTGRDFLAFARQAKARGWKIVGLASDLFGFEALYGAADLHVGYRVHAHIFSLSRRISSILINEDARGVGQCKAMGAPNLTIDGANIAPIEDAIAQHFERRGETVARSVETMRATFPVMRDFLRTL